MVNDPRGIIIYVYKNRHSTWSGGEKFSSIFWTHVLDSLWLEEFVYSCKQVLGFGTRLKNCWLIRSSAINMSYSLLWKCSLYLTSKFVYGVEGGSIFTLGPAWSANIKAGLERKFRNFLSHVRNFTWCKRRGAAGWNTKPLFMPIFPSLLNSRFWFP